MQYSNTENNFRLSKGDRVKFKFVLEFDDIKFNIDNIGYITDITNRDIAENNPSDIENSYLIKYKLNDLDNYCWCTTKDVIPYSVEDEREEKLNKILNG